LLKGFVSIALLFLELSKWKSM